MIEQMDVSIPAEYISEVIPIRYAKVDDIANALNALGGGGSGASVSIGTSPGSGQISGLAGNRSSGLGQAGWAVLAAVIRRHWRWRFWQPDRRTTGLTTPNGTPSGGNSFQQRLNNIINATGGGGGAASRIKSSCLARRKSFQTRAAVRSSFTPRGRTWKSSKASSPSSTCRWRRC